MATEFCLRGVGLLLSLSGSIWILVIAFSEGLAQGLLCLLVPCYILFFTFSRWQETKGAFVLEVLPFANWLVFFAIGFGIVVSGKADVLNQVADGGAPAEAVPAPEAPQAGLEASAGIWAAATVRSTTGVDAAAEIRGAAGVRAAARTCRARARHSPVSAPGGFGRACSAIPGTVRGTGGRHHIFRATNQLRPLTGCYRA